MAAEVLPALEIRSVRQNQSGMENFASYDVFVDGKFHCSTRFSDFAALYDAMLDELLMYDLPKFPPKKLNLNIGILSLKDNEVEVRRVELEKFFKAVFKEPKLLDSPVLKKFLYDERDKYLNAHSKDVTQVVHFVDSTSVTLNIKTSEKASRIKQLVAEKEGMSEESSRHFMLFMTSLSTGVEAKMYSGAYPYLAARKLQTADEEDPHNQTPEVYRIYFKKWIFSPYSVMRVMQDRAGLKHLFNHARADIANHILRPEKAVRQELERIEKNGDYRGYMLVARTIPGYYAHYFAPCTSDYPQPGSRVIFSVSTDGMVLFLLKDNTANTMTGKEEIVSFSFERIRRWKYVETEGMFGWEYFFGTNQEGGRWINLKTEQYFDMNTSTQEYVDELKRRLTLPEYFYKEEDIAKEEKRLQTNPSAEPRPQFTSSQVTPHLFRPPPYLATQEPATVKSPDEIPPTSPGAGSSTPTAAKPATMPGVPAAAAVQRSASSGVSVPVPGLPSRGSAMNFNFKVSDTMSKLSNNLLGRQQSTENAAFAGDVELQGTVSVVMEPIAAAE